MDMKAERPACSTCRWTSPKHRP